MSEYPDYYPPFMRDFHDQKDLVVAFYTWLDMMDTRQEVVNHKEFSEYRPRRVDMCAWPHFHTLLVSFVDFLDLNGYRIYKARTADGVKNADGIDQVIKDLKDMPHVWHSLVRPDGILSYKKERCIELMDKWSNYLPYMPEEAQRAYREAKKEQEQA